MRIRQLLSASQLTGATEETVDSQNDNTSNMDNKYV